MKAELDIFPEIKTAFICIYDMYDITGCTLTSIKLDYSDNIKELELQVLLHGYTILKQSSNSTNTHMIIYDLEQF